MEDSLNDQEREAAEAWLNQVFEKAAIQMRNQLADGIMDTANRVLENAATQPPDSAEYNRLIGGAAAYKQCAEAVRNSPITINIDLRGDGYSADDFFAALRGE